MITKPEITILNEIECEVDLYDLVSKDQTDGSIRHYYKLFPNLDEEVAMLCYQASRDKPEDNENFIREAQKMVDERNAELLKNFGKNYINKE